ncbi:MAG: thioredoxin-like domain-containing protein [Gemmatales bacterium]|nr:thioredoxin-like domain-containing protein [Gemmatales bacterium]
MLAGLVLSSCAALNPKNWPWPANGRLSRNPPEQNTTLTAPGSTPPPAPEPPARTMSQRGNGLLAGQVIDAYYQRQPHAAIQVALADGGDTPREVQTDHQGYFVIQGLTPGQRYKLLAKSRVGEKVLTGITFATPPNVVVNIIVREDLSEENKPAPPVNSARRPGDSAQPVGQPQSWQPPSATSDKPWAPAALRPAQSEPPTWPPPAERPASPPSAPPLVVPSPSLIGQKPQSHSSPPEQPSPANLPLAQLANPVPWPGVTVPQRAETTAAALTVPGCRVRANRVEDFALYELTGRPFRLREAPARLTLLDFWGTWCRPCLNALPHLVDLQRRYGSLGLQVIGIAYEDGTLTEQQQRINFVRQRFGVNYRILLGNGENCPVKQQLAVQSFPTLILLDGQGNILWRCEGLDSQQLAQLESEISRRLH